MSNFSEIDANMVSRVPDADGLVWYTLPAEGFDLYGFTSVNPYRRVPDDVAKTISPGVRSLAPHTAGGRVRFSTDSSRIAIRVKMPSVTKFAHMALTGSSSFDLYLDTDTGSRFFSVFKPDVRIYEGFTLTNNVGTGRGMRSWTLNFPLYSPVSLLEIGLDANASVGHGKKYRKEAPIVYYGSSITQGACATRPGLCYESIISRKLDLDHVNLGFSGQCKAEIAFAEYLAGLKMLAFVCDYDHNTPNTEYLRDTHLRLYQIIREKNPDLPYIMVSAPDFYLAEESRSKRRAVVEDTYRYAREHGDRNVYYIDGEGLTRGGYEDSCTADGCHPNDIGFMFMAEKIGCMIERALRNKL